MSKLFPFANRTHWTLKSNELTSHLKRLQDEGTMILDLTESNPTRCDFSYPKDEVIRALQSENNLRYDPDPRGLLQAREAIGHYYKEKGLTVSANQIFLTSSTSEAYMYLMLLLVNPREQVLFPRPSYPLFSFLGDLNDVRMDTYPLVMEHQWRIDLDALTDSLKNDTKAIVFVNPNNPTGSFIQPEEIDAVNALCRNNRIALICDEVFTDFSFDQKEQRSLIGNKEVLTFVLGGLSKTLGLPQMKLSWIVMNGPQKLVEDVCARLEVIADTYLSVNTPAQNALSLWLTHRDVIQNEIRNRIQQNYTFLQKNTQNCDGCQLLEAQGGWYAVLKINDAQPEEQWVLSLLTEDHVYVYPGYFFDFDEEPFLIISLLPPKTIFEEGISRILKRIDSKIMA